MSEEDFSILHSPTNGTDRVNKTNGTTGAPHTAPGFNPRSCVTCRRRKVKCDKREPCSNCTKARIECIFPSPGRAPRKARKPPDSELIERLRKLESVVQNLGVNGGSAEEISVAATAQIDEEKENFQQHQLRKVANAPGVQQPSDCFEDGNITSSADTNVPGLNDRFGRLVVTEGKSRYINSSFWANLASEVEDLKTILNENSEDEDDEGASPDNSNLTSHQSFIFGFSSSNVDMSQLHPPPEQIPKYWTFFKENVDILAKILHIPSMDPVILGAAKSLTTLTKPLECLMFAVYYGCATSLTPQECIQEFGESKETLLSKYRFGIEQALARAGFLDSQESSVLQALVLYLILLRRNDEARIIWTLTGLVVRIAQTIGLHRDGTHFNLKPFEIEMRRRLWWQICILDARASEDHGCDPTITEAQFDTQMPLNINDSDLNPDMKELPTARVGFTDMTFCLMRFEIANVFRRIMYIPPGPVKCQTFFANLSIQDKEKWIGDVHARLEDTYLKHCDMTVPLYWVTATISRLVLSKMWLVVYHPFQRIDGGTTLPQEIKDKLFITSLESVEYAILLETEKRTKKWNWLFKTYVQWHSLAFMLSELCVRTHGDTVERAWRAIESSIQTRFPNPLNGNKRGALWRPLRKLMIKARAARELALARERSEMQAQAQACGLPTSPSIDNLSGPIESYPAFDALLSRGSMQWDSPPAADAGNTPLSMSPTTHATPELRSNNSYKSAQNNDTRSTSSGFVNQEGRDFVAKSNMGMHWLLNDLQTEINTEPANAVDWANWDDMVRQFGMGTEDPMQATFDTPMLAFDLQDSNGATNDFNGLNGATVNTPGGTGAPIGANIAMQGMNWF